MPVSGFKDNTFVITIAQKPLAVLFSEKHFDNRNNHSTSWRMPKQYRR